MSKDNTSGRNEVLSFIEQYYAKHGVSPSIREIVAGTKYRSTSAVWYAIGQLREDGLLITPPNPSLARLFIPTWLHEQSKELIKAHANHSL